jgi:hypothetical protein
MLMLDKGLLAMLAATALLLAPCGAQAFDESRYPDFKGQWERVGAPRWVAPGQKAPLTPEYQAINEAQLADQAAGGQGNWPSSFCIPQGMPAIMNLYDPMEIVVTQDTTYVLISHINDSYRRIYTDGREWPAEGQVEPSYAGYSIGKWVDTTGSGHYDALEVETRYFRGPRAFESTGLPLHRDNQSVIKERIYLDQADRNILYDDITVSDHALTQPWTLHKKIKRVDAARPVWRSDLCEEDNALVRIGKDGFFLSADGYLMPTKKGQAPPDLRYFKPSQP